MSDTFVPDLAESIRSWRKWYLIGSQTVRQRYARSRLGQFWISLSYLIMILALGIVYTQLWHTNVDIYLPFLAISMAFWNLISGCINDAAGTFIAATAQMHAEYQPKGIFCLIVIFRQLVFFSHNFVVLMLILLYFHRPLSWTALLLVPDLMIIIFTAYWLAMLLGIVCARFRDVPNIVQSFMQIMFFIMPIMWMPQTLSDPGTRFWLTEANPFAAMLDLLRAPLLNQMPTLFQYGNVIVCSVLGWGLTAFVFNRCRDRIVYWL
jgi:ABC-type polysaccharide/polyol phosphate export permease